MKNITKEQYEKAIQDYKSYSVALESEIQNQEELIERLKQSNEKILFCKDVMKIAIGVISAFEKENSVIVMDMKQK